jgi:hypothetical protein
MIIDPGEDASSPSKVTPKIDYDTERHKSVIENQFCNICQIIV